jgi:hypothetical protein
LLAKEALRFLERLCDEALKVRLREALEALREDPFHAGAIKMSGPGRTRWGGLFSRGEHGLLANRPQDE